jgi:prepilin-type N-terminal cleavage/methylation domain-containing protein
LQAGLLTGKKLNMRLSAAQLRRRAGEEAGYTLLELLVVLVILGVLGAIALSTYLGVRDRASRTTAQANVRAILPALEAFHADRRTYVGASLTVLRNEYDLEIDDSAFSNYTISGETDTSYCVQNHIGNWYAWAAGPSQPILVDTVGQCA